MVEFGNVDRRQREAGDEKYLTITTSLNINIEADKTIESNNYFDDNKTELYIYIYITLRNVSSCSCFAFDRSSDAISCLLLLPWYLSTMWYMIDKLVRKGDTVFGAVVLIQYKTVGTQLNKLASGTSYF